MSKRRETIGFITMGSLPDDDAPLMETHGLHFTPATDTGEAPEGWDRFYDDLQGKGKGQ